MEDLQNREVKENDVLKVKNRYIIDGGKEK